MLVASPAKNFARTKFCKIGYMSVDGFFKVNMRIFILELDTCKFEHIWPQKFTLQFLALNVNI